MKTFSSSVSPLYASLIFLALAAILPFLQWHHQLPITSFYSEWVAFALGLLAALPLFTTRYWQPMHIPRSVLFVFGLILLLLLQAAMGRVAYLQQIQIASLYLLWSMLLLWLGHMLKRECGLDVIARWLAWALLLGALLSCGLALIQYFDWATPFNRWINRATGSAATANLGQQNHLANYLALGLASMLYLHARRLMPRMLLVPGLALLGLVLAMTGSRSAWLYLLALLALAFLWQRRAIAEHQAAATRLYRTTLWLLPLFALAQWALQSPFLQGSSGPLITPTERLFAHAGNASVRWALLRESFEIWLAYPVLGAGFGQFAWQHFQLASAAAVTEATVMPNLIAGGLYNHSHNIIAQFAAEMGGAGLAILLGGLVAWLWGWRGQALTPAHWWVAGSLAILGLHSLLEYPLWYAYFLGLAAFLIGATDRHEIRLRLSGLGRAAFGIMLVLAWVSAINLADAYSKLEGLFRTAPAPTAQEIDQVLNAVRTESILTPYSEFAYATGIALDTDQIDGKLALNTAVMRFAPTSDVVYRQTVLLALQGEQDAAQTLLKRALVVYPAGVVDFMAVTTPLVPKVPGRMEPLRDLAQRFYQEWKQHEVHTR